MRPRSAVVGYSFTIPEARGHRVFPYVMSQALERLKQAGFEWAYGDPAITNVRSRRGLQSDPAWKYVGRLLLRRRPFGQYHIVAATIENPEGTVFGNSG
jgi:hypothetical protein